MPFRSDRQKRFLFAKHPEVAKKFVQEMRTMMETKKKKKRKKKDE